MHLSKSLETSAGGLRASDAPHAVEVGLPASSLQSGHQRVPGPQHFRLDAAPRDVRVRCVPPRAVVALQRKHAVWSVPVEGDCGSRFSGGKEKHLPSVEEVQHSQRGSLLISI